MGDLHPGRAPVYWPLNAMRSFCTLGTQTAPNPNVSASVLDCRDDVVYSEFLFLQTSWCQKAQFWFYMTTTLFPQACSESFPESFHSLATLRWACICAFSSRETLQALRDFSPLRHSVLSVVLLTAFRSLTSYSHVVLGWSTSSWSSIPIRQDLTWRIR